MAMGKPVVTTRIDAHSDFVDEDATGYYVDAGDSNALRDRIQRLLDNPDVAAKMGEASRKKAEVMCSLDAYCSRIETAMGLK
jgi:glycosyltransferase involved in cell wall biosynthesis